MVLEALTWRNRLATKDIADPCTLLTITHQHRDRLSDWKLHSARTGARQDAARALHELVAMLDRGQRIDGMAIAPARLSVSSAATSPTLTRADHLPVAAPLRAAGRS